MVSEKNNDKLRKKAEEILDNRLDRIKKISADDTEIIHELRVHQTELEIQNEELRKSQRKLEDSQRKYFDLYNFAPNGYFTLDKDGIILDVNLAGAALLGVGRTDLYNTAFIRYIPQDYRNHFHHHLQEFERNIDFKNTTELKLLKRDNGPFYAHLESTSIPDRDGNFKEFRIAVTDITPIKNTEKALKGSEERYREIFVNNPAVMMIVDPSDGAIIDANPAASNFYGYSLDEMVKMKISDINVTDEFIQDMQQAESNQKNLMVLEHRLSNGNIRDVNVQSGIIAHKGGNVLCSIIQDITAQKKAEMSLRERNEDINEMLSIEKYDHEMAENKLEELIDSLEISNKAIEQFAYVSSHDLREPLRMITSFLQLLKRRYANELDDDANDFINYAVEGAKRLDMMINDLLEFSEIGTKERELEYLHSDKIVKQVLTNLETKIRDTNAEITYDSLPIIYANEYQMIQLFENIIDNAIKFRGRENPKIRISAKKEADEYIFAVKDNGIGIEKQHLERIFNIFQRLHSRGKYYGSGMGLSISQRIIQEHKGKIWAISTPGKGSTFYFTIPIKIDKNN
ncbi:MAG TPA: PAS domain S-box protein [Methanobacterium sp.]